jgi:predicted small lipoprotein YifL
MKTRIALLAGLLLAACGQKGDLYLPDEAKAVVVPATTTAAPPAADQPADDADAQRRRQQQAAPATGN